MRGRVTSGACRRTWLGGRNSKSVSCSKQSLAEHELAGASSEGNEPGGPLKGYKGWFIGVIPSFPAEHQQLIGFLG